MLQTGPGKSKLGAISRNKLDASRSKLDKPESNKLNGIGRTEPGKNKLDAISRNKLDEPESSKLNGSGRTELGKSKLAVLSKSEHAAMNKSKTVGPRSSGLNNVTLLVAISKSNLVANNKSKIVGPPSSGLNVMLRTGTAKSKPDAISKNKLCLLYTSPSPRD